ncbi:MAG TPA: hypothetical protein VNH11_01630 [Pirellulales bacterium]|nr:hypothetical protein [Pirellulales bacterium]
MGEPVPVGAYVADLGDQRLASRRNEQVRQIIHPYAIATFREQAGERDAEVLCRVLRSVKVIRLLHDVLPQNRLETRVQRQNRRVIDLCLCSINQVKALLIRHTAEKRI